MKMLSHACRLIRKVFSNFIPSNFSETSLQFFKCFFKILCMRAVQKVRSHIFVFFFRPYWNKLPRGDYSGGLYDYTVKIWKLYVCFSSCFSLLKVELPVAGAAKFEMLKLIHFFYILKVSWLTFKVIFQSFPLEIHF